MVTRKTKTKQKPKRRRGRPLGGKAPPEVRKYWRKQKRKWRAKQKRKRE